MASKKELLESAILNLRLAARMIERDLDEPDLKLQWHGVFIAEGDALDGLLSIKEYLKQMEKEHLSGKEKKT